MPIKRNTPEKAMRYARYIVQDIGMYNKDKIEAAIKKDTFFEELQELFEEGKEQYESGVDPEILKDSNFFERAIVDVLLYRKRHIDSPIWD